MILHRLTPGVRFLGPEGPLQLELPGAHACEGQGCTAQAAQGLTKVLALTTSKLHFTPKIKSNVGGMRNRSFSLGTKRKGDPQN